MRRKSAAVALLTIAIAAVSATDHDPATTIHSCISEDTNDGIVFYNTELPHDTTWDAVESDGVMLHRVELGQTCESIGLCGNHCPATKEVFDVATSTITICTLKPFSDACDARIKYDKDGNFKGGECQYKCSDLNEDDNGKSDVGDNSERDCQNVCVFETNEDRSQIESFGVECVPFDQIGLLEQSSKFAEAVDSCSCEVLCPASETQECVVKEKANGKENKYDCVQKDDDNKDQAKHKLADRADFTKPKGPKV